MASHPESFLFAEPVKASRPCPKTGVLPIRVHRHFSKRAICPRRSPFELRQAALEEATLGLGVSELERSVVGGARVVWAIEAAEQLRSRRVQVEVAVELEAVHYCEGCLDIARLGDRGGSVELDHRGTGEAGELAIQGSDLGPV